MAKYFSNSEISCNCGCGANHVSQEFIAALDRAREISGVPYIVNRMCSCPDHNRSFGGSRTSSHLSTTTTACTAVDIRCTDSVTRLKLINGLITAGFRRIGIAERFIHADMDKDKPACIWLY